MFGFGTKFWKMQYSVETPYGQLQLLSVSDLGCPESSDVYVNLLTGTEYDQGKTLSARFKLVPTGRTLSELRNGAFYDWFEKYGKLLSEWWTKNQNYNSALFVAALWEKHRDLAEERETPGMYWMAADLRKDAREY